MGKASEAGDPLHHPAFQSYTRTSKMERIKVGGDEFIIVILSGSCPFDTKSSLGYFT